MLMSACPQRPTQVTSLARAPLERSATPGAPSESPYRRAANRYLTTGPARCKNSGARRPGCVLKVVALVERPVQRLQHAVADDESHRRPVTARPATDRSRSLSGILVNDFAASAVVNSNPSGTDSTNEFSCVRLPASSRHVDHARNHLSPAASFGQSSGTGTSSP